MITRIFLTFSTSLCLSAICAAQETKPSTQALPEGFVEMTVEVAGKPKPFLVLSPEKPDAGKTYPVILFLHGAGERGTDNRAQLKHFPEKMAQAPLRQAFPCFLVAPQCEPEKQWVEAPWGEKTSKPMAEQPSAMLSFALASLEKVLKEKADHIDPNRIYLTGLSMGGFGTWELAARKPDLFAAAAPICGGGDENQAAKLKDLPLWAFHGDQDTVVWPVRSQTMIQAIKSAGGSPKYSELAGVGHNAWSPAYDPESGLLKWMFEQRKK